MAPAGRRPTTADEEPVHQRHNFSPSAAQVGDHFVLSSSVGLARDLIKALKAPGKPGDATLAAEADGAALAGLVERNRRAWSCRTCSRRATTRPPPSPRSTCSPAPLPRPRPPVDPGSRRRDPAAAGLPAREVKRPATDHARTPIHRGLVHDPPALTIDPSRAWAPSSRAGRPWDLARVAHLHRRAGFAAPWAILQRDLKDGPAASVDRLLEGEATGPDGTPAPEFAALLDGRRPGLAPSAPGPPAGDLALPDDLHRPPAPGADDPVLARPLRHVATPRSTTPR